MQLLGVCCSHAERAADTAQLLLAVGHLQRGKLQPTTWVGAWVRRLCTAAGRQAQASTPQGGVLWGCRVWAGVHTS